MSWSIEERIGECRPFPAQVVVYRGETDECMAYVSGEVADRLKAENAKLRELLRDVWRFTKAACEKYPRLFDPSAQGGQTVQLNAIDAFEQRMRELGIEEDK